MTGSFATLPVTGVKWKCKKQSSIHHHSMECRPPSWTAERPHVTLELKPPWLTLNRKLPPAMKEPNHYMIWP